MRAPTSVYLSGGARQEGTSIRVTASQSAIGFWLGRGGAPMENAERIQRRHAREATEEVTDLYYDEVKRRMPRRSGASERSIEQSVSRSGINDYEGLVYSNHFVVRIIEEGTTGPIRPTTRKVLKFPARGGGGFRLDDTPRVVRGSVSRDAQWVFRRQVSGVRGQHIFRDTLRDLRPEMYRIYRRHARTAAMEVAAL
jgi:hypothetical protein